MELRLQIRLTIGNAHGENLVNTVTEMNILLMILKLQATVPFVARILN